MTGKFSIIFPRERGRSDYDLMQDVKVLTFAKITGLAPMMKMASALAGCICGTRFAQNCGICLKRNTDRDCELSRSLRLDL